MLPSISTARKPVTRQPQAPPHLAGASPWSSQHFSVYDLHQTKCWADPGDIAKHGVNMARRVFLSYPCNFPVSDAVVAICNFVAEHGCILTIPPEFGWTYYSAMEEAIERADAFVAVLDPIADGSTQLLSHLHYAATLQRVRWSPRPRIHGLWLEQPRHVAALDGYSMEMITTQSRGTLLEDLPPRN
jgi:hypothetical protein